MTSDETLAKAKSLIKSGRKKQAAVLLRQLVKEDRNDYRPWLYLAMVVSPAAREKCIAQAESIAPDAPGVQKAKVWLEKQNNRPTQPQPIVTPIPTQTEPPNLAPKDPEHVQQTTSRNWAFPAILLLLMALVAGAGWLFWPSATVADTAVDDNSAVAQVSTAVATQTPQATETAVVIEASSTLNPPTKTPEPTSTTFVIQPKEIARDTSSESRTRWTPTPIPTNTPSPTPTLEPTFVAESYSNLIWPEVGISEQWIDVNLTTQKLVAFEGKTPIFETAISSGRAPYYTVTGQFRIYYRLESQTMDGRRLGFDYVTEGVPHVQYFYGDFALHGAYWHNSFGQPMSHGCVNLSLPDAEWLYEWADYGMLVNVHY